MFCIDMNFGDSLYLTKATLGKKTKLIDLDALKRSREGYL